jgi:nucleoid-associated protein YgaU
MARVEEAQFEVRKIREDMQRLQTLIDRAISQLETADRLKLPDSTPYFSFKRAEKMEDLLGPRLGLRGALRNDIAVAKMKLKEFEREAQRIARGDYARVVERQHEALLQGDRDADRRARGVINRAAETRGALTEEEFAEVQGLMLRSVKGHTDYLRAHPSRQNIKEVLDRLGQAQSLGMADEATSQTAMKAAQKAAKSLVDKSLGSFMRKPTPAKAQDLLGDIATNELLGGESAMSLVDKHVIPGLKRQMEKAEREFRNNPTSANCDAMFNAEYACVDVGGPMLPDPPKGLRRIKSGSSRMFGPRDTLSAVSKEYYGSWGYWDVIFRANWGVFGDPDRPTSQVMIKIPY